jgi:hypothetical protein
MDGVSEAVLTEQGELRSPRSGRTYRLLWPFEHGKPDVKIHEAVALPAGRRGEGSRLSPQRVVIKVGERLAVYTRETSAP